VIDDLPSTKPTGTCPHCGRTDVRTSKIDAGLKLRLKEEGGLAEVPAEACDHCMKSFAKMVSRGAVLRAERAMKEEQRLQLWRNRVGLVKKAKQLMMAKLFSDAAVAYEKYLRVLEVVYERKPGELSPELFSSRARKHEITIIASAYWDLMRIYDVNSVYKDRQMRAAEKLAEFVRYTPVYPSVVRKAEEMARTAKNPDAFRHFLKTANAERPRCFIATAAFGEGAIEVHILSAFRDHRLSRSGFGRGLIWTYYLISPSFAKLLDSFPFLKPVVRSVLRPLAFLIEKIFLNPRR